MAPRYEHPETGHTVETSHAVEGGQLRAAGYAEQKARTASVREADAQKQEQSKG